MSLAPGSLAELVAEAIASLKGLDAQILDVRGLTDMTDFMVIASGRSDRQVKALAEKILEEAKKKRVSPLGVEGQQQAEWVLIDFGDVIAHIMRPDARDYYQLEKLWQPPLNQRHNQ